MGIEVGQYAPDFTLFNTEKKTVSLSDFKGENVLILFFPLAFTSVCTVELCAVRDNISFYSNVNATVLGISVDSLYALGAFKSAQNLNIPLLSDFNKTVSTAYEAMYETFSYGMKGVSKRAAFIVDKESKIAYAEVLENAGDQPNFASITSVLKTLS
ncbi:MAG: redoxin domain-containing protein [Bacteroidota bacterium]